jgi:hypothetical protein
MAVDRSSYSRRTDDTKIIARITGGEGTDSFLTAASSDPEVAKDSYFKDFIKSALKFGFCTPKQLFNFYERWMGRRLPQIMKEWRKILSSERAAIIEGSQQITEAVGETRKGDLVKKPKCQLLQYQGEDVYNNPDKAKIVCRQQCGQFWRDRRQDTTLCPLSRYDLPSVIFDMGDLKLRIDEITNVETLPNPKGYQDENTQRFINLLRERRAILGSPWYTNYDKTVEIQEFRTLNPIGILAFKKIQQPLIDIMKAAVELKRGCKNYGRHIQRLVLNKDFKCKRLREVIVIDEEGNEEIGEITDYNEMLEFCENICENYRLSKKGDGRVLCRHFYCSLAYMECDFGE